MRGDRKLRFLLGIGANLYGQMVVALIQIAGVPILLHCWGGRTYGEWLIVCALPSYLSMTDLGFSMSAGNDMTRLVAVGDSDEAQAVFQSVLLLLLCTTSAVLILMLALLWVLPVGRWLHLGGLTPLQVKCVIGCLAAEILIKLFDGLNHAGFRANGAYALHQTITSTTPLLQQGALWTVACLGGSPLAAVAAYLLVRAVVVPATMVLLLRRCHWLHLGVTLARWAHLARLFKPALGNLALPLAQALGIQGMVLVVGGMLGPLAVVAFSTMRTLTRLALQLVACISYAAEPEFAAMLAERGQSQMAAFFQRTMRLSLWIAIITVAAIAALGPEILRYWTHGAVRADPVLLGFLLATVLSQTLWNGAVSMLKACNRHLRAAMGQLVSAAAALLLAVALLRSWQGIDAAGAAVLVADTGFLVFVCAQVRIVLDINVAAIVTNALYPRCLRAILRRPFRA